MLQTSLNRTLDCPACGRATTHAHLYKKYGCDIVRCESCGLGRTETQNFDPTTYYTEDYFAGGYSDGYADYRGAEPVLRREFARVVEFFRQYRAGGRLLEIGCAYGFFLQEAKRHFEVVGIELAEEAAAHARASGLQVVTGVADEPTLAQLGTFDAIVLLDVVEHLSDPRATLALCSQQLRPGGVMLLTTGDFASPMARLAGAAWRLMTPPQHLWFFTPESMRRFGTQLGLQVDRIDHPWKVVPLSLIVFQLKRMLRIGGAAAPRASRIGVPVNLFDAMRVMLRKPSAAGTA